MTLEDFFTLTEMNNGLTVPLRVRELMAFMEKERDSIVKNAADCTRQWSAVASAIVATANKDCLDLFLRLDGLHFISKWLKDAQKFSNDKVESFVEEAIAHLLQALEKLDVDYEQLVASGIWTIVENLLVHNSSKVQDKARALFEGWKTKTDNNASTSDVDKAETFTAHEEEKSADTGVEHPDSSTREVPISGETSIDTKDQELTNADPVLSTSSDAIHPNQVESANNLDKILSPPLGDERSLDHVGSPTVAKPTMEPPPCLSVSSAAFEPCSPAVSRQDTLDPKTGFHHSESSNFTKQTLKDESLSEKLGSLEDSSKMSKGRSFGSSSDDVKETKAETELCSQAGDKSSCDEVLSRIDERTTGSDGTGVKDDSDGANHYRTSRTSFAKERGDISRRMLTRSSSNEKGWGHYKDGKAKTLGLHVNNNNQANNYTFGRKLMDRGPVRAGKNSDVEIDYGIIDPLEIARQVAIEVGRENVDYREPSCSPEKLREGDTRQPHSPDSMSRKQSPSSDSSPKEVVNDLNLSNESSPMQEESATSSENLDAEQTNGARDMETFPATEAAREAIEEKGLCNFDLNQVCLEDSYRPANQFSAPVSVVSASRAAAASALPSAPLQFEGNLGWKGSAVTSAFRPASPRRMPECDKDPSTGGSSSSSKKRQGFFDFDLNVAESIEPRTGESSAETSSRRSEHLALDLNNASEDGSILDWRIGQYFPQGHSHHNQLHLSSSSKQPVRNIDLNDGPSYRSDSTYVSPVSQNFNVSGGVNSDGSVISIMGTKVEVNRKDFISQTPPLPNGRTPELAFDVNLRGAGNFLTVGSALPYTHSSIYGYGHIAPGPSMPFSSSIYGSGGPIPYMVDSRGQPVIPQIVGNAFSQPPFVINMNSATPSDGAGPSRSNFDLNSGMLVESGSKDPSGFGLFLNSAQIRSVDEQLRPDSQPTMNSVIGGKRKEPDNGWEHFPFRHYTPPWKQS